MTCRCSWDDVQRCLLFHTNTCQLPQRRLFAARCTVGASRQLTCLAHKWRLCNQRRPCKSSNTKLCHAAAKPATHPYPPTASRQAKWRKKGRREENRENGKNEEEPRGEGGTEKWGNRRRMEGDRRGERMEKGKGRWGKGKKGQGRHKMISSKFLLNKYIHCRDCREEKPKCCYFDKMLKLVDSCPVTLLCSSPQPNRAKFCNSRLTV